MHHTPLTDHIIEKGSFMGLNEGKIVNTNKDQLESAKSLIEKLVTEEDELLTILYGEDVDEAEVEKLTAFIEDTYDLEVEIHDGKQPIYSYIFSVE